jgi:hypothetical protein
MLNSLTTNVNEELERVKRARELRAKKKAINN